MRVLSKSMIALMSGLIFIVSLTAVAETTIVTFEHFIKNKVEHKGYFSFFHDEEKGRIYLEINRFNQEFLFQSAMPHGIGSNDIGLDRGQLGDTRLVKFERVGDKVFLRQLNSYYRADTDNPLEKQAVNEAFASSIIWGFKVEQVSKNKQRVLIDYTPFLLSDIHNLSSQLKRRKQGNYKIDVSRSGLYIDRTKAFPNNTELEATVTYKGSDAGDYLRSVTPDSNAVTVNLHHSLIKLPDDNYQSRTFHPQSGYWAESYADYASDIDQSLIVRNIPRHRLKKKNPEAKISEAIEPIVYYLDAGVPEPIRSALLEGARWWDQGFTAIGYKNAFQVKMMPEDADPMDVRYNVIQWVHRATRGWSYGSSVIDPRSGEILKGHVTLGSLRVRQDYLIALGLTSPFKTKNTDTSEMKEMALARIRQLSAHEVGHTLGIAHNFAASINNRASVMDYPHPLITLKEGRIDLSNAYATDIGRWDKLVVDYGYADIGVEQEDTYLANIIEQAQIKGLKFISDPDARSPSSGNNNAHLWDNGKNASEELMRVLAVRKKALNDFGLNSIAYGRPLSELEQVLVPIYNFHRFQVSATAKMIGGLDYSYEIKSEKAAQGLKAVSAKQQSQALSALLKTLESEVLTLSTNIIKLIPPKAYGYSRNRESFTSNTGVAFDPITAAEASAKHTLTLILNNVRLARVQQQAAVHDKINNVAEILDAVLSHTIYQKAEQGLALLVQQRVNHQVVQHLIALWQHKEVVPEVRAEIYQALDNLAEWLDDNFDSGKYRGLNAQFKVLAQQIEFSLDNGKQVTPATIINLPPGSPIGG